MYYTGESCIEYDAEADGVDVTEHPHDDKPRPYLCTVCDKRFTMKGDLIVHKRTHCGNLNDHKLTHSGKRLYSCTQCEKRFSHQCNLRSHMNVHSGIYKCTECGKSFSNNQKLTVHSRSHSGEKPFECSAVSYTHLTLPTKRIV